MMINKRLIGAVPESKKYIAGNVALQWCSLLANIAMMSAITELLAALYSGNVTQQRLIITAAVTLAAVAVRYGCTVGASRMGYLSSKAVKKTLRGAIYDKLLRLGASYSEQVKTSEVVQVAVEGVDQLETYFGAYLPQFFYAMLAPLTLFVGTVLCQRPGSGGTAHLRAAHPCGHCSGADVGEKAALQILGTVHGAGRHVPGKFAGPDYPEDLSG